MFLAAWLLAGAVEPGYSPVRGAISRLAAVGASTRVLMTGGLLGFSVGALCYASALRSSVLGPASKAAFGTGVATLGVVVFPLGVSSMIDAVHAAFAVCAYAALAATPVLAARPLAASGRRSLALLSLLTGVVTALCLAGAVAGAPVGLWQRVGLTLGHAWIVWSAAWLLGQPSTGLRLSSEG